MEQTTKPYRDNPELNAYQRAIDAANQRAEQFQQDASDARGQRNAALIILFVTAGAIIHDHVKQEPAPPTVRAEQDASIITAPMIFCDADPSGTSFDTLQLRCWSPLLTMTFDQRPSRYWRTACAFGLGCPLHRQCPRHPHWRLLDPLPSLSGSDAGTSSQ